MRQSLTTTRNVDRLSWSLIAILIVWSVVAIAGWYGISSYGFSFDPEATSGIPARWPSESTIERTTDRPTLVLFLHPQCPCSRATVAELERLSTLVPAALLPQISVIASAPRLAENSWWSTPLLARAAKLPRAKVLHDAGGIESARFDARVSGTVLLFDDRGDRLYAGGVTMARGHDGDNAGMQAITELLIDHTAPHEPIPPFGCRVYREDFDDSREVDSYHTDIEEAEDDSDAPKSQLQDVGDLPA